MVKIGIIVFIAFAVSIIIRKINLARDQQKEAAAAIVILWAASALTIAVSLHLSLSPPTDWITAAFAPIYKPIIVWIKGGVS